MSPEQTDHRDCAGGCLYGLETGGWPGRVCPVGECHRRSQEEASDPQPAPPDGFDYLHYGFLKGDLVRAHVAVLSNGKWVHNADWDGKTIAYIAIRRGTEPHRLNFQPLKP